jgi:hypothetical protein
MYWTIEQFKEHIAIYGIPPLSKETASVLEKLEKMLDIPVLSSEWIPKKYKKNDNPARQPPTQPQHTWNKINMSKATTATTLPKILRNGETAEQSKEWGRCISELTNEKWVKNTEIDGPFKKTVIETKEGIEHTVNEIRIYLNKMSKKNYETQKEKIFELIGKVENDDQENFKKIAHFIFEISSSNKFFCELYAMLYKELMDKYVLYENTLNDFIETFKESLKHLSYCNQNEDYEKYCNHVKESDKKKGIATFIPALFHLGVISKETVFSIVRVIQSLIFSYLEDNNNEENNTLEELGDILFIIVSSVISTVNEGGSMDEITVNIKTLSSLKLKENRKLSSRFLFKMQDLQKLFIQTK